MTSRPTLADLRGRVFKHSAEHATGRAAPAAGRRDPRDREIGNWLARRVGRPAAVYGTWLAVRLGLSANQVTSLALAASLASAVLIATGTRWGFLSGIAVAHLAYWLDHVDGQVARWRGTSSLAGVYFDYLMHHAAAMALGFALGFGLAIRTGDVGWSAAGFLVAGGWTFLGLHNDCRYKAFFQRLKREEGSFRVEGGAGGRPAPPAPWPRRGLASLSWPVAKACEPHVVLMTMTTLALVALGSNGAWLLLLRGYVAAMAILAPTLALARAGRAILGDSPGAEFDRWFRPLDGRET